MQRVLKYGRYFKSYRKRKRLKSASEESLCRRCAPQPFCRHVLPCSRRRHEAVRAKIRLSATVTRGSDERLRK
jgi:hypothetical protein